MLALQITALKPFMNNLLAGDLFDCFLLKEAVIATAATMTIDGRLNKEFFDTEEWEDTERRPYEYAAWADMKGICFDLIKGKRPPVRFQCVFYLMPKHTAAILEKGGAGSVSASVKAFVLTLRYDGEKAALITGISYETFLPDKEPERLWDAACEQYLRKKGIACEPL